MSVRKIIYTISSAGIYPKTVQHGGLQNEHCATKAVFSFATEFIENLQAEITEGVKLCYRFDAYDGAGAYHPENTEPFSPEKGMTLEYEIKQKVTAAGGSIKVFLVISKLTKSINSEMVLYTYPALIEIESTSNGTEEYTIRDMNAAAIAAKKAAEQAAELKKESEESEENAKLFAKAANKSAIKAENTAQNIAGLVKNLDVTLKTKANKEDLKCRVRRFVGITTTIFSNENMTVNPIVLSDGGTYTAQKGDVVLASMGSSASSKWLEECDFNKDGYTDEDDVQLIKEVGAGADYNQYDFDIAGDGEATTKELSYTKLRAKDGWSYYIWTGEEWRPYTLIADRYYKPDSLNPQSGIAVKEAIAPVEQELKNKVDKTDSIILNDYENNIAEAKGFKIVSCDSDNSVYTIDISTDELYADAQQLAVGDTFSVFWNQQYDDLGTITAVFIESGLAEITVSVFKEPDEGYQGWFRISSKPLLGEVIETEKYQFTAGAENKSLLHGAASFGRDNQSNGRYSFTCNKSNTANYCAFANGRENKSIGQLSDTGGSLNENRGWASFVRGCMNFLSGTYAACFGQKNISKGNRSLVTGAEHDEAGSDNVLGGIKHFVRHSATAIFGRGHKSTRNNQTLLGQYSDPTEKDLFNVGNGTSDTDRSSAFRVKEDGTVEVQKGITANGVDILGEISNVSSQSDIELLDSEPTADDRGMSNTLYVLHKKDTVEKYIYAVRKNKGMLAGLPIWDGTKSTTLTLGGEGTQENPYKIYNGEELYRAVFGKGNGKYYELCNDIVLNDLEKIDWETGEPIGDYVPNTWTELIGTNSGFGGYFNGNGHSVYGLYYKCDDSEIITDEYWSDTTKQKWRGCALFPCAKSITDIKNLGMDYTYIRTPVAAGAVLAVSKSYNIYVDNCYVGENVNINALFSSAFSSYGDSNTNITNCYSLATYNTWVDENFTGTQGKKGFTASWWTLASVYGGPTYLNISNCYDANGYIRYKSKTYGTNNYMPKITVVDGVEVFDNSYMKGTDVLTNSAKMPDLGEAYIADKGYPALKAFRGSWVLINKVDQGYIYTEEKTAPVKTSGQLTAYRFANAKKGDIITLYAQPDDGFTEYMEGAQIDILSKNLTEVRDTHTSYGVTFQKNDDGSVYISGTATQDKLVWVTAGVSLFAEGEGFTVNVSGKGLKAMAFSEASGLDEALDIGDDGVVIVPLVEPDIYSGVYHAFEIKEGITYDLTVYPQVELGNEKTRFEPFRNYGSVDFDSSTFVKTFAVPEDGNYSMIMIHPYCNFTPSEYTKREHLYIPDNDRKSFVDRREYDEKIAGVDEALATKIGKKQFEYINTVTVAPDEEGNLPTNIIFSADSDGNAFELTDFYIYMYAGFTDSASTLYMAVNDISVLANANTGFKTTALRGCSARLRSREDGYIEVSADASNGTAKVWNPQMGSVKNVSIPPLDGNIPWIMPVTKINLYTLLGTDRTWLEGSTFELYGVRK